MHTSNARIIRRLFPWVALISLGASAVAQNFSTAVLTSQTQTITFPFVSTGTQSTYTQIIDQYTIGPDARFFQPGYGCMGGYGGGCSTTITFSPPIVPPSRTMSATLVIDYMQCTITIVEEGSSPGPTIGSASRGGKPNDLPPGSSCATTSQYQSQVGLFGTVTGSLPAVGPQAQFFPPAVVPLVAAPAHTESLGLDSSGNLFVGTDTSVLQYAAGGFSIVAGTGTAGYSGNGGPAIDAQLNYVSSILQNPQGGLLLTDGGNEVVRSMSVGGNIRTWAGDYAVTTTFCFFTEGNGNFNEDFGGLGTFCDSLQPQGPYSSAPPAANTAGVYLAPDALATDGSNVFISNPGTDTVAMVTPAGLIVTYAGFANCVEYGTECVFWNGDTGDGDTAATGYLSTSGELNNPRQLAVDPYANLFIASGVLRMVNPANIISTPMLAGQTLPTGPMGFDHIGHLFLGEYLENSQGQYYPTIQKITFDSNASPIGISTWATTGINALTMGTHGEVIAYDGTNINIVGAQGSLTFQNVDPGETSPAQTVTISNPGDANLLVTSANTISGTNAGDFKIASDTCTGTTVAPGGSCSVAVTFKPTAGNTETATIAIASNASTGSLSGSPAILLTGIAAAAPTIAIQSLPATANEGVALTAPIVALATGGAPPYTFTSSLNSTNGNWTLTQNGATLSISGTPHVAGSYPFTITVTDSGGLTAPVSATLPVAPITVTPFYQQEAQLGYAYMSLGNVQATGGVGPYTYTVAFPAGSGQWAIALNGNGYSLTGMPIVPGNLAYTITATDSYGATGTYSSTLQVAQGVVAPQIYGTETIGTSSTSVSYSGTLLLGGLSSFYPNQALPTGTVQFSLDGQPLSPVAVAAGVTPAMTLSTDILYHALTMSNYSGDGNYYANTNYSALFNINGNRAQTISFTGYPTGGYLVPAGSTFALTAHASSGLPVTYLPPTGGATLDASGTNLILPSSPGQVVTVTATQAGNLSFAPAPNFTATFTTY